MRIHLGNNEMTFEELKTNVEQWAEARGIYEHSTAAWDEIKDRKGHMVPGGAFVKEEGDA